MIWDEDRLRALLGDPALGWLRARLRRSLSLGRELPRSVVRKAPSAAERDYVDRLFGRRGDSGGSLSVDLARLTAVLVDARVCDDLVEALTVLEGPIEDRAARAQERLDAWARLDGQVEARIRDREWLLRWYGSLRASGVLMRLARQDAARGAELLRASFQVIDRLPEAGVSLPELAASALGDAHALDPGRPVGTIVIRAAAALGELEDWQSSDGRRDAWAAAGVLCDELSAPVLTLGLGASGAGLADRVLELHRETGEACSLTLRQLVRHRPRFDHLAGLPVFVCENPAVVAAAVERLGRRSAPLVCTAGYLRGATRLLLRMLATSGARLRVRADFDVEGVQIAAVTLALPHASAWRFDAATYASGPPGPPLTRAAVPETPWDPPLSRTMYERGVAVHEEAVLPTLLRDLAERCGTSAQPA